MRTRSAARISYAAIAAALAEAQPMVSTIHNSSPNEALQTHWKRTVLNVADVLSTGNTSFNRKRFLTASGVL